MQQFYYLAVLFVAGGIGSALIVAADLRTRRQPMRIMESVWVLTALWASFFGLWAYFAFGRAARHMPVQNNGIGKQKDSAKISEPAKGGGIGENGNERKVGSAGQETENRKPGTGRRKDLSVAGTDPWKVSEPEPAMNMPEPGMHGMQMENGTTTGADGAEDMPGMKGTALKAGMADEAGIPGMTNRMDMPGTMEGMDGMGNMPGMKGRPRWQPVVLSTLHCGAGCTLADIIGDKYERVFHMGRLDYDSEGLILMTNDGELSQHVMHPKYEVEKTYIATIDGKIGGNVCRRLVTQGVQLDDGLVKLDHCAIIDANRDQTIVKVVLHSGKNRIVRRIFGAIGYPVRRLVRTQIGPIKLGDLKSGTYRVLSQVEVRSLQKEVGL